MKTVFLGALLSVGLIGAVPAIAQSGMGQRDYQNSDREYHRGGDNYNRDRDNNRGGYDQRRDRHRERYCDGGRAKQLRWRIKREVQEGDLNWQTARGVRASVDRTAELERRLCAKGIQDYQAARLDRRYDQIERDLRNAAR